MKEASDTAEKDKEVEKQMEQDKGTEDEENDEFDRWLNDEAQFGPHQEK